MVRNIPTSMALLILSFKTIWIMLMGYSFSNSKRLWTRFPPKSLKSTWVSILPCRPYSQKNKWASRPSTRSMNLWISSCSLLKPINTRLLMLCTLASSSSQIRTKKLWITWMPSIQTLYKQHWSSRRFTEMQSSCTLSPRRVKSHDLVHFYLFLIRLSPRALTFFFVKFHLTDKQGWFGFKDSALCFL